MFERNYEPFAYIKAAENPGDLNVIENMFEDSDDACDWLLTCCSCHHLIQEKWRMEWNKQREECDIRLFATNSNQ